MIILMRDKIDLLAPEMYPLLTLLANMQATSVRLDDKDNKFEWEDGWNYLQWFKKTINLHAASLSDDINYYKRQRLIEMCKDIERSFFFGQRNDNHEQYSTMGGIEFFVPSVEVEMPKNIADLHEIMNLYVFGERAKHHSGAPFVFVPSYIWKMIKEIGVKITVESTYGVPLIQYFCLRGMAYLVEEKMITDRRIFAVSLDDLAYRYREDRDIQIDGYTSREAEVSAYVGLDVRNPNKHLVIKG